jgi:hypothetical protein
MSESVQPAEGVSLWDQGAQNGARTIVTSVPNEDDCPPLRHAFPQVKGFLETPSLRKTPCLHWPSECGALDRGQVSMVSPVSSTVALRRAPSGLDGRDRDRPQRSW